MSTIPRALRAAATVSAGLLVTLTLAAPTHAATPATALSVTSHCEADGGYLWDCVLIISGGVAPYTTTWTPITNAYIAHAYTASANGSCALPGYTIKIKVIDSNSHHVTVDDGSSCLAGPPP